MKKEDRGLIELMIASRLRAGLPRQSGARSFGSDQAPVRRQRLFSRRCLMAYIFLFFSRIIGCAP